MDLQVVILALIVGGANWVFRYLPMKVRLGDARPGGVLSRFLAATGPAAIATLFVASVLPMVHPGPEAVPFVAGTATVVGVFVAARSVVGATLAGSVAYGAAFAVMGAG